MKILFRIKTRLMMAMMEKYRNKPFDAAVTDLYELPENADPMLNSSCFFGGDGLDGQSIKMRVAHRSSGMAEVFVIYRSPDGRFYATDKQLFNDAECPLSAEAVIPGRDWKVKFCGKLKEMASGEYKDCSFELKFTSRLPVFYPMTDGDFSGMAKAFARQRWNRKFFRSLSGDTGVSGGSRKTAAENEAARQYHYEQTGHLDGKMVLDGKKINISLAGIRDRATGRRDWNYMDCHVWLVAVTGKGEVLNLSIVSYPHAKNLYCGYTDIGSDRNSALVDYKFIKFDHCEGKGPDKLIVDCTFANGKTLRVTADRTDDLYTPFDGGNFYFHEAVGNYDINGIPARGTIELGWNKDSSRWGTYDQD